MLPCFSPVVQQSGSKNISRNSTGDLSLNLLDHDQLGSSNAQLLGRNASAYHLHADVLPSTEPRDMQRTSSGSESSRKLVRINPREGLFHAMLSYRVNPDQDFVCKLYNKMNVLGSRISVSDVPWPRSFKRDDNTLSSKVRVFQDFYCLKDGNRWEGDGGLGSGGFVGALCQSVIFVPLFSAHLKPETVATGVSTATPTALIYPAASVPSAQDPLATGSIGSMKYLNEKNDGKDDTQDSVLLELILAMELHKHAHKTPHTGSFKTMFPCSVIFPLFQSNLVFDMMSSLSAKPHVVTNQKALVVLKTIGVEPSIELANGTLSPVEVVQFYVKFQGMKLFDYGAEVHQIDAAAKRLLQCVEDAFSDLSFDMFDTNYAEVFELRKFLTAANLLHFYPAMVANKISSVEQFASLHHADRIVEKLAADASRVSKDSEVCEVLKLQTAICLAQKSPLARPLEERFLNFVDSDASFLTAAFSSSAIDIMLGKSIVQVGCVLVCFATFVYINFKSDGFFPKSFELNAFYRAFVMFEMLLLAIAGIAAKYHSPRFGRYFLAATLVLFALYSVFALIVSVYDAMVNGCEFRCGRLVNDDIGITSKVVVQAVLFSGIGLYAAGFAYTVARRQDLVFYTGLIGYLLYWFCIQLVTTYIALGTIAWFSFISVFCGLGLILLPILKRIGMRRAEQILSQSKQMLDSSFDAYLQHRGLISHVKDAASAPSQRLQPCIITSDRYFMEFCRTSASSELLPLVWETQFYNPEPAMMRQNHANFTALIKDSEFVNVAFQEWVSSWLKGGPSREDVAKYFCDDSGECSATRRPASDCFERLYSDEFEDVCGEYIRGPVKHVDRAISKAYRSYFGDFRRLTDIVRCAVVLNSPADIQAFLKVERKNQFDHSHHAD